MNELWELYAPRIDQLIAAAEHLLEVWDLDELPVRVMIERLEEEIEGEVGDIVEVEAEKLYDYYLEGDVEKCHSYWKWTYKKVEV